MNRLDVLRLIAAVLAVGAFGAAPAQRPPPKSPAASAPTGAATDPNVLTGTWVRPDGGYVIEIKSVAADGELQAIYFNPSPLPFAKAQAVRDGSTLRARFEIRAGGYNGSTYDLRHDPVSDRLIGIYYQAVAKQRFEVEFLRK